MLNNITTDMEFLYSSYSDLYKDVHGIRPGNSFWNTLNDEEKVAHYNDLNNELIEVINDETLQHEDDFNVFESHITTIMTQNNVDRSTALRWDLQAEGYDLTSYEQISASLQDLERYLWGHNISQQLWVTYIEELKTLF